MRKYFPLSRNNTNCEATFDTIRLRLTAMNAELLSKFSFQFLFTLQYSLLQTVVEACQKKRRCRFLSSPKTFGGDPCPGHRKFIEVAYKCRPGKKLVQDYSSPFRNFTLLFVIHMCSDSRIYRQALHNCINLHLWEQS